MRLFHMICAVIICVTCGCVSMRRHNHDIAKTAEYTALVGVTALKISIIAHPTWTRTDIMKRLDEIEWELKK